MGLLIKDVAAYLPEKKVANSFFQKILNTSDEWIRSRTGIEGRHFAEDLSTSDMALRAASGLEIDEEDKKRIKIILHASFTPDYIMPSIASMIQGSLELGEEVLCLDINMACTGFAGGLILMEGFLKEGELGILVGTEKISKHLDFKDRGTAILFGDGSGGVLVEKNLESFEAVYGTRSNLEDLTMKEGEPLQMRGQQVFRFATEVGASSIKNLLEISDLKKEDIDYFVCHQANERILDFIAHKLQISPLLFPKSLRETGNVSAASIPLLLAKLKGEGAFDRKKKVVLTGFGAGLSWASLLVEVGEIHENSQDTGN